MDKLNFSCLLIFSCLTFLSVKGRSQEEFSSCQVHLFVKRGTTFRAAPNQTLTVECPVKHCGESLNVTWCKILDTDKCEPIKDGENVEISQESEPDGGKLISYLIFKRISIHDDGLYMCDLKPNYHKPSYMINISVSASYQGVQISHINKAGSAARFAAVKDAEDESWWLLYFYVCVGISVLAAVLMLFSIFRFYSRKGVLIVNQKMREEIYTNTLPGLPKPPPMAFRSQPAAAGASDRSLSSDSAVYAAINRRRAEEPARELQGRATNKSTEYASIRFVNPSPRREEV